MKVILFGFIFFSLVLTQRLSINDPNCNKYLQKFGTANNPDGTGVSKIAFRGDVYFISETTNVKVNLRYSDVDLFNDDTYFGLVQEDGKPAASTCLDLKIWKFSSDTYSDPVQVTDLTITPQKDIKKLQRYYSFTIPGAELGTRLVETSNSMSFIYNGFYAIAYYAADTDQVYHTFYFEFSVTVDKTNNFPISTSFKPLSYSSTIGCTPTESCSAKPDTVLKWCADLECTSFGTPDLHLNDLFVLQQIVTTAGMNYYLTETEVWYTANGLNHKARIMAVNNETKGQAIILLRVEIVWWYVTIKVISTLSTTQTGERRLLVQTTYDTVSGQTEQIECLKTEGKDRCPTCKEEEAAEGYSRYPCKKGFDSNGYILIGLITLLIMI